MKHLWLRWAQWPYWWQNLSLLLIIGFFCGLVALGLWQPLWQKQQRAKQQEPLLQEAYQKHWEAAQQHPLWAARLPLAKTALHQQQLRLPNSLPVDLSQPIHQLVVAHHLNLKQIRPLSIEPILDLEAHLYSFSASGEAHALLGFIRALRDHPDGLIMTHFQLSRIPNQQPTLLSLEAQLHTLRRPSPTQPSAPTYVPH